MPNLVDTLVPSGGQDEQDREPGPGRLDRAGLTGTLTANPNVATNYVLRQTERAYTCVGPNTNATIRTQVDQP